MAFEFNPFTGKFDTIYKKFVDRDIINGSFKESFDSRTSSNGTIVTMDLEQTGGGDLTMYFSDGLTKLDTTPKETIELTTGTNSQPQKNYIFIPQSTKVLTKSIVEFPAEEHIKIGFFFVSSANKVQEDGGVLINQNWNDHIAGTNQQGHLGHIAEQARYKKGYFSGVDANGLDDSAELSYFNFISGSTAYFKSTSGIMYQLHRHTIPDINTETGDDFHIINKFEDEYFEETNIGNIITDSTGSSLANKYFNLYWFAVGNKTSEYSPLMCMVPGGSYSSETAAVNDTSQFDNLNMPREFNLDSSVGVPICRMTLKFSGGTSTLSHIQTKDLRTETIIIGGAGGSGGATNWLSLTDTPGSFSGQALKIPSVNSGETALEFIDNDALRNLEGGSAGTVYGGVDVTVDGGASI